jgi:hypothetical protein
LLHSSGYYVNGNSNLRIFLRQEEIRARFPEFALGQPYMMRATLILDVGKGGQSGMWSDAFIERVLPMRTLPNRHAGSTFLNSFDRSESTFNSASSPRMILASR